MVEPGKAGDLPEVVAKCGEQANGSGVVALAWGADEAELTIARVDGRVECRPADLGAPLRSAALVPDVKFLDVAGPRLVGAAADGQLRVVRPAPE